MPTLKVIQGGKTPVPQRVEHICGWSNATGNGWTCTQDYRSISIQPKSACGAKWPDPNPGGPPTPPCSRIVLSPTPLIKTAHKPTSVGERVAAISDQYFAYMTNKKEETPNDNPSSVRRRNE